tara:strand:+ start:561 stop:731 length:171 start_codon:yes stop_codon:yes gene_type:complete
MDMPKVIITKQKAIVRHYPFENEVGLSSYDLALISINKIINKSNSVNDSTIANYLI